MNEKLNSEIEKTELTFRRGYLAGVCAVLDAIENGTPVNDIQAWAAGPLNEWRYVVLPQWTPPPNIPSVEKS